MSGFEEIAAETLQTTDSGTVLFFPRGMLGRGFIVPNEEQRMAIQTSLAHFLRNAFWGTFAALLVGGSLGHGLLTVILLEVVILTGYEIRRARLIEGLKESPIKYDRARAERSFAARHSVGRLSVLIVIGMAMTSGALYVLEVHPHLWLAIIPAIVLLFSAISTWGRMIKAKVTMHPIDLIAD